VAENSTRLARLGYSDSQIIIQTKNRLENLNLIFDTPTFEISNNNFNNRNLKVIKIEIIYKIFGLNAFKISSKSYAF